MTVLIKKDEIILEYTCLVKDDSKFMLYDGLYEYTEIDSIIEELQEVKKIIGNENKG